MIEALFIIGLIGTLMAFVGDSLASLEAFPAICAGAVLVPLLSWVDYTRLVRGFDLEKNSAQPPAAGALLLVVPRSAAAPAHHRVDPDFESSPGASRLAFPPACRWIERRPSAGRRPFSPFWRRPAWRPARWSIFAARNGWIRCRRPSWVATGG